MGVGVGGVVDGNACVCGGGGGGGGRRAVLK